MAELAGIPSGKITLVGVDKKKRSWDGRVRYYHIFKVPSFILYYDGKESGRIIESVQTSIEADMVKVYCDAGIAF